MYLSAEQIGSYVLLLVAMWNAGGRLPLDEAKIARIARVSVKRWRAIGGDVMSYFTKADEGFFTSTRLAAELVKTNQKSEARAAAGAIGGKAKALKNNSVGLANATNLLKQTDSKQPSNGEAKGCHSPEPVLKEDANASSKRARARDLQREFGEFWGLYPNRVGKADAAEKFEIARRKVDFETMMAGLRRYIGAKPPDQRWLNPATWLIKERWDDEPANVTPLRPSQAKTNQSRSTAGLLAGVEHSSYHGDEDYEAGDYARISDQGGLDV